MTIPAAVTARAARLRERYAARIPYGRPLAIGTAATVVVYSAIKQPAGLLFWSTLGVVLFVGPIRREVWYVLRCVPAGARKVFWPPLGKIWRRRPLGAAALLGVRFAVIVAVGWTVLAFLFDRVPAFARPEFQLVAAVLVVALVGGWRPNGRPTSGHDWEWYRARLGDVIGPKLYREWSKIDPKERAEKVGLSDPWTEPGAVVNVAYPRDLLVTNATEVTVRDAIAQRLGGSWQGSHQHDNYRLRYVRQGPTPTLPTVLPFTDAPLGRADWLPIGVDVGGNWMMADLPKEPHILISGRTTSGKSTATRSLVAAVLHHGGLVDIIDSKVISLGEFRDLPNVRYHDEPTEFGAVISEFKAEVDARMHATKAGKDLSAEPLRVLVLEEIARIVAALNTQWQRTKPPGARAQHPALDDLVAVLQQGRQLRCHVITTVHKPTERSLLERDQYAVKIAVGPQSESAWSLLFGSDPVPDGADTAVKGRAVVGTASADLTVVQLPYLSSDDARWLASQGAGRFPAADVDMGVDGVDIDVDKIVSDVDMDVAHVSDLHVHTNGGPQTPSTGGQPADVHNVHIDDRSYQAGRYSDVLVEPVTVSCSHCAEEVRGRPGTTPKCRNRHTVRIPKAAVAE